MDFKCWFCFVVVYVWISMDVSNAQNYDATEKTKTSTESGKEGEQTDLQTLLLSVEQNNKIIDQLSSGLARTKKKIKKEQRARKAGTSTVVAKLSEMEKSLNEILTNQNNVMNNQNDLTRKQNDIISNQNDAMSRINVLQHTVDTLKVKSEVLEEKMDSQEKNIALLASLTVSEVGDTGQNHGVNAYDVAKELQDAKEFSAVVAAVSYAPEQYCNMTAVFDLGACLQTRFPTQYSYLRSVVQLSAVRLVDGKVPYEGRVEITYQERTGTVCDEHWDDNDARVVCRMLGYTGGTAVLGPGHDHDGGFDQGTGDILLSALACTGEEDSLFSCNHDGFGADYHYCYHYADAGVRCDP